MVDERIHQMIISMVFNSSIYGFILSLCKLQPDETKNNEMWVTIDKNYNPVLGYNPNLTKSSPPEHLMKVFKHECFHLANNHIVRGDAVVKNYTHLFTNRMKELHTIVNIAMDLAVNSLIPEFANDERYYHPNKFPGLPSNLSFEHYFNIMMQVKNEGSSPDCKSNEGNQKLKKLMDRLEKDDFEDTTGHDQWISDEIKEEMGQSDYFKEKIQSVVSEMVKTSMDKARSCGLNVQTFEEIYKKAFEKTIPYYEIIKRFVKSKRAGKLIPTLSKINRKRSWAFMDDRQPIICPFPGTTQLPTFNIGTILDTSGSMDEDSVKVGLSGVASIIESDPFVTCTVIENDQEIVKEYKVKKISDIQFNVCGHRGTTLFPAFSRMKELKVDVVLCFTDGYCEDFNSISKASLPKNIIWIITPGGTENYVKNTGKVIFDNRKDLR